MKSDNSSNPIFGQPGWRRRALDRHGWDKEFATIGWFILALITSAVFLHADDRGNELPQDPKDLSQQQAQAPCDNDVAFAPLPAWSHYAKMPALPDVLKPMGHSPIHAKPSPAAVAETKPDTPPMPKKLAPSTPNTVAAPDPALVAVSPFLQWIKDHPQAAAAEARKESGNYSAPAPATPASPTIMDPYWMPPMIDGSEAPPATGGSAAIYSTPQK